MRTRIVLRLELGFKKLSIEHAIVVLQEQRSLGATHVRGMYVRWEEQPDHRAPVDANKCRGRT